jgi:hypothetical protein
VLVGDDMFTQSQNWNPCMDHSVHKCICFIVHSNSSSIPGIMFLKNIAFYMSNTLWGIEEMGFAQIKN